MIRQSAYEILGVPIGASLDEVTSAYKKMVQLYHPDKVSHLAPEFRVLAENRMRELNAAYEELKNLCKANPPFVQSRSGTSPQLGIETFFSFAGFNYGDTMVNAHRILGRPKKITDDFQYSFIAQYYFPDEFEAYGFELSYDRNTGLIVGLGLRSTDAAYKIRSKGVIDPNLSYLGQHWNVIQARLGNPTGNSNHGNFEYELYRSRKVVEEGLVTFLCYQHNDYICSSLELDWFHYKK